MLETGCWMLDAGYWMLDAIKLESLEARKLEGRFGDSVLAFQPSSIMAFQPNICEVNMEGQVRAHVIITGRVQGVFFRVETQA